MTKKIFHSILLVAGTVLLASLLVIMGCLYEYFGSVEKKQLRDELELAAVAVKENGTEYLSQLSSERYRLTWIENDGTVLYDTVTDAESLENHADRVEVKQALEYGEGESTRYSSTLLQKTMYCAERLADGSVLRISMSRATAGVLLVGMGQPILVVLIVALILSSVLAKSLSHRIVQPLNKLDLEHPLENDAYEELAPLLGRINRQHLQIDEQMDELQRQQTEFSQITSSMREGLVLLDEKEHVLSINPAAEKLFGTDESCVGQDFLTIDRSHDMSLAIERAMDEGHSEARVERGGRIWQFDVSRIGASGAAGGGVFFCLQAAEDILFYGHIWEQGVVLEQQSHAPLLRRQVDVLCTAEQHPPVQHDASAVRLYDACNAPQGHAFAAAGSSQQSGGGVTGGKGGAEGEAVQLFFNADFKAHFRPPAFCFFSSRFTASSTTAEITISTSTHCMAPASSLVRQSW